jgi:hypothetical protein
MSKWNRGLIKSELGVTGSCCHIKYTNINNGRLKSALAKHERAAIPDAIIYILGRFDAILSISYLDFSFYLLSFLFYFLFLI